MITLSSKIDEILKNNLPGFHVTKEHKDRITVKLIRIIRDRDEFIIGTDEGYLPETKDSYDEFINRSRYIRIQLKDEQRIRIKQSI